jgi:CRP/FNR family cyclic AMP-dependent transcriptional regulator
MPLTGDDLKRVPLFAGLGDKQRKSIAKTLKERTFPAGAAVTVEGENGVGFFVIEDGEAEVTVGGEPRRTLGPGDHFGEVALLGAQPRTASITATTDLRCSGMTSWQFRPLVESDASLAWGLLQALARMLG